MNILVIKTEIERLNKVIEENENKLDELQDQIYELESCVEGDEKKKDMLIQRMNDEIVTMGATGTGNEFIDTLRKTFPYVGANNGPSLFRAYYIDEGSVFGTNGIAAFEITVDGIPEALKGKYLFYEAGIEPDKIEQHTYTKSQLEGNLDADELKRRMLQWLEQLNNRVVFDSVSKIMCNGEGNELKVELGNEKFVFDYRYFRPLVNIFPEQISVSWSKINSPICIQDKKTIFFICPLYSSYA
jgi:hypothetical protein